MKPLPISSRGHYAVDLDGTLAFYDVWRGYAHIGAPITPMVERVKRWLQDDIEVRVFTARIEPYTRLLLEGMRTPSAALDELFEQIVGPIYAWCEEHVGMRLPVTCMKDFQTLSLWDDRATEVHFNEGTPVNPLKRDWTTLTAVNHA